MSRPLKRRYNFPAGLVVPIKSRNVERAGEPPHKLVQSSRARAAKPMKIGSGEAIEPA
jgi:hypothetical protein